MIITIALILTLVAILISVLILEIRIMSLELKRLKIKNNILENKLYLNNMYSDDLCKKLSFAGKNFIEKTNSLKEEIKSLENKINANKKAKTKRQSRQTIQRTNKKKK